MKRASGEEQKRQRREDILEEVSGLLTRQDFESVTLASVAARLGLVKGTLYRYFPTKEALVLDVLEAQLSGWLTQIASLPPPQGGSAEAVADLLALSLAERPLLVKLFSIVHVQLEKHLSVERLVAFKRATAAALAQGASLVEGWWPALRGRGVDALLALYALAIGVGHLTDRPAVVEEALLAPGLEVFRLEFESQLRQQLTWTLRGLAAL